MAEVGRDLKDHLVPDFHSWTGFHPLDQTARAPIQPGLEHIQGWGTYRNGAHKASPREGGPQYRI